jgi:hypothetical protein
MRRMSPGRAMFARRVARPRPSARLRTGGYIPVTGHRVRERLVPYLAQSVPEPGQYICRAGVPCDRAAHKALQLSERKLPAVSGNAFAQSPANRSKPEHVRAVVEWLAGKDRKSFATSEQDAGFVALAASRVVTRHHAI